MKRDGLPSAPTLHLHHLLLLATAPYYLGNPRLLLIYLDFLLPSLFASQATSESGASSTHQLNIFTRLMARHMERRWLLRQLIVSAVMWFIIVCDSIRMGALQWPSINICFVVYEKMYDTIPTPAQKVLASPNKSFRASRSNTRNEYNNQPDVGGTLIR